MEEISIALPSRFDFSTEIQFQKKDIKFKKHDDTDTFVAYAYIMETFHRFLKHLSIPLDITKMRWLWVDCKIEAEYNEILTCKLAVNNYTLDSCDFSYVICNKIGEEILRAKTQINFYSYSDGEIMNVPKRLRTLMLVNH